MLQEKLSTILRFVRCIVAGKLYCIKMNVVRNIKNFRDFDFQEGSEQNIFWIAYDDKKIPVINLQESFNHLTHKSEEMRKVLIFNIDNKVFGIVVDSIDNMIEVPPKDLLPMPCNIGGVASFLFDSLIKYQGDLILSFSPEKIYDAYLASEGFSFSSKYEEFSHSSIEFLFKNSNQRKMIIFSINNERSTVYGLSVTQVPQILQVSNVFPIPGAAEFILGVIEWRGIVLPVVDLSICMGEKKSNLEEGNRFLIVRLTITHSYIALPIQSQVSIQSLPFNQALTRVNDNICPPGIYEKFQFQNKTLVIPNIDSLIGCLN